MPEAVHPRPHYGRRRPVLDNAGHVRFGPAVGATSALITQARTEWFLTRARTRARLLEVLLLLPAERRPPAP
ncbi:hypothetical protein ABZV67_25540 [Streptomyces sp. NPDC005065]|uniref:hypothetical protein n=1 Tax=unclassified Streptomyces TaxID=2593676 RepID=UPI0033A34E81